MAYTINQGDTLSKIAAANKTTVQDIMKANPNITDPNKIQAGASLNLPSLAQSNGVRANFPSTPAPTNTTLPTGMQTSTPATTKPTISFATPDQPAWKTELQNIQATKGTYTPANIPFTWSGLGTAMTGKQPTQTTLTGGQRAGGISTTNLPSYGTPQATGGSTTGAMAQTAPSTTTTGTQGSQANTEASSAGSKVGNTFVMQNGTVIDATTGKVISGPTSSQAQTPTVTTPASIPDGKTTPTGQPGYTDTRDLSYGGLIQQSLQQQIESANRIKDIQNKVRQATANEYSSPDTYTFKVGHAKNIADYGAQQVANEQANLANLASIYGKAIGAVAPIAGSAYALDPVTGKIVGGGAGIGQAGNVVGNLEIAKRLPEMQANLSVAQQSQDTIRNLLGAVPELQSSSFSDLNGFLQAIGKKVSDPNYQTLANTISQFVNSIAQATGQSPDAILLNTKAQGQSMQTVLANLMAQAQNRYAALSNQAAGTSLPVNTTPTIGQSLISGGTGNLGGMTADSWGNVM